MLEEEPKHVVSEAGAEIEQAEDDGKSLIQFPVVEYEKHLSSFKMDSPLQENVITHSTYDAWGQSFSCFGLRKKIGEFYFIFTLQEIDSGTYTLNSTTDAYGFATTDLDPESVAELFRIRASFVESLTEYEPIHIKEISSQPANTAYSVADIRMCTAKILEHPENIHTSEELAYLSATYRGADIFDIYKDLFGEYFHGIHPNHMSRSYARSRLFKMMFRKYLKRWQVIEFPGTTSFSLRRKDEAQVEQKAE